MHGRFQYENFNTVNNSTKKTKTPCGELACLKLPMALARVKKDEGRKKGWTSEREQKTPKSHFL